MKFKILKTPAFWAGLTLYEFSTIIAIIFIPNTSLNSTLKVVFIGLSFILYFICQIFMVNQLSQLKIKQCVQMRLADIKSLQHLDKDQNLRANIFILNRKRRYYYIAENHNMEADSDKNINIPENMGCTGEAWRNKTQVWGNKAHILKIGDHRIPEKEVTKVRTDLEWVCSTPIVRNQSVVAVLNFDGNRQMDFTQQDTIKQLANRVTSELSEINFNSIYS